MLLINLFGPPGAGKSTTRADVFRRLKIAGVNCEEVTEYAKALTWEKRDATLRCQPYVFGKQLKNIEILKGQVDVVITDSPLLLTAFYGLKYCDYPKTFYNAVAEIHNRFDNMNFFINRVKPYQQAGRWQDEKGSDEVGKELREMLAHYSLTMDQFDGNNHAGWHISTKVLERLKNDRT